MIVMNYWLQKKDARTSIHCQTHLVNPNFFLFSEIKLAPLIFIQIALAITQIS